MTWDIGTIVSWIQTALWILAGLRWLGLRAKRRNTGGSLPSGKSDKLLIGLIVAGLVASAASLYWNYKHPRIVERVAGMIRASNKSGLKYVWIPSGTFTMGCSPTDPECNCLPLWHCHFEENPAHSVTLSKGFWIGQTEVTVAAYKTSLSASGKQMPVAPEFNRNWEHANQPIVNVTWDAAKIFCNWDGGHLPTEAEWEYAARGRSTLPQYGNVDEIMWHSGNSNGTAQDVATKVPNYIGLFDMLGNAWEWVDDWFDEDYYKHSPASDPKGPENGNERILRGGSWSTGPSLNRLSDRNRDYPTTQAHGIGVRCVQDN